MEATFQRKLKDIPELVEQLRTEKARQKDYLLPQAGIEMQVALPVNDEAGKGEVFLKVGEKQLRVMDQAHGQIAGKMEIPKKYYDRMLVGDGKDQGLLAENVNHWMLKSSKKKRFVRAVDDTIRAFLGSRYRPIAHLDLVTQAVQVITGQEPGGNHGKSWAQGARCFSWMLNPMNLDVEFVNPRISVDMNNLAAGYKIDEEVDFIPDSPTHGWLRAAGAGRVFPTVRIRNSETGHGGLTVTAGFYEAICDNTCHIGFSMATIHVGRELSEQELWSEVTHQQINATIFSKTRDVVRACFNPDELLKWAKRFKGLEEIEVHNINETVDHCIELGGMTEGLRDDILAAYYATTQHRGNLFDVQRAFTGAAHALRETKPETAANLEDLGGLIIERGKAVVK